MVNSTREKRPLNLHRRAEPADSRFGWAAPHRYSDGALPFSADYGDTRILLIRLAIVRCSSHRARAAVLCMESWSFSRRFTNPKEVLCPAGAGHSLKRCLLCVQLELRIEVPRGSIHPRSLRRKRRLARNSLGRVRASLEEGAILQNKSFPSLAAFRLVGLVRLSLLG
jgi:hypothetical protein